MSGALNSGKLTPDIYDIEWPDTGISSSDLEEKLARPSAENTWYFSGYGDKHVAVEIPLGSRAVKINHTESYGHCLFVSNYNPPYATGDATNYVVERVEVSQSEFILVIPEGATHIILTTSFQGIGTDSFIIKFA